MSSAEAFTLYPGSIYYPPVLLQDDSECVLETAVGVGHQPVSLPFYARVEVFAPEDHTECIMVASLKKLAFGEAGDGITVYSSATVSDMNFRTRIFQSYPDDVVWHDAKTLRRGRWNLLELAIAEHRAIYWINGCRVATCNFTSDELSSSSLHVGMISHSTPYRVRRFQVSQDPSKLQVLSKKVVTLRKHMQAGQPVLKCTSIAGTELVTLIPAPPRKIIPDTPVVAVKAIQGNPVTYCESSGGWVDLEMHELDESVRAECDNFFSVDEKQTADETADDPGRTRRIRVDSFGGADGETLEDRAGATPVDREHVAADEEGVEEEEPQLPLITIPCGTRGMVRKDFEDGIVFEVLGKPYCLWVTPDQFHNLKITAPEERLADVRFRLAGWVGLEECDLHLVLPDGRILCPRDDWMPLSGVFDIPGRR